MPHSTRDWLQRFVDGINHYQARIEHLPAEYAILGLNREPWRPEDVLTFGRLAGADVKWIVWFNLLKLHRNHQGALVAGRKGGGPGYPVRPGAIRRTATAEV